MQGFEKHLRKEKPSCKKPPQHRWKHPGALRNGEQVYSTSPKRDAIRLSLSQIIHHRAQIVSTCGGYPLPGSYGSAGDMRLVTGW
jgi:hypothetical protein